MEYLYIKKRTKIHEDVTKKKKKKTIETTPWDKLSRNLIDLTFNIVSLVSY